MNQDTPPTLGGRVRLARLRKGLKVNQLDRAIGCKSAYTVRLEADAWDVVGSDKLAALSEVLGVTTDWLVKGIGDPPPDTAPPTG